MQATPRVFGFLTADYKWAFFETRRLHLAHDDIVDYQSQLVMVASTQLRCVKACFRIQMAMERDTIYLSGTPSWAFGADHQHITQQSLLSRASFHGSIAKVTNLSKHPSI